MNNSEEKVLNPEQLKRKKAQEECKHIGEWHNGGYSSLTPATVEFSLLFTSLYCKTCGIVETNIANVALPKTNVSPTIAVPNLNIRKN